MRKILLLIWICCQTLVSVAQKAPRWMEKQRKAVLTITVYNKDNQPIATGNGFFVSDTGDALSAYSLFKNAARAEVKDPDGNTWPVERVLGADELYDVIKFHVAVSKRVTSLSIASEPVPAGKLIYLMPFAEGKKGTFKQGLVREANKLKEPYSYYKLSTLLEAGQANIPVLTESGDVFGLAQEDASGKNEASYAVSAGYANSLQISSTDVFSSVYQQMGIKRAWPTDLEQAQVALYLFAGRQDPKSYLETLNDFVACFPRALDGYLERANHLALRRGVLADTPEAQHRLLDQALADLQTAAPYMEQKSDLAYYRAKLIFAVASGDSTLQDPVWNVANAMTELDKAIAEKDLPLYHQMRADFRLNEGQYEEAYEDYMIVNRSESASPATWYWASKAKAQMPGANIGELIALLDSAVVACGNPPSQEAASYILERIDLKLKLMNYTAALEDYELYYKVMNGAVNDGFYYYREQAKFRLNDLEGALSDIQQAMRMAPMDPIYAAEEASVYVRMENYEAALKSVENALKLAPDFGTCYRLKGICFVRQKKMNEACEALRKAKELGDPLADRLIKQYCK
ncbi:MAG: trypsin-like peptidase domain-containing protein [Parabacteroides sp.]